MTKSLKWFFIAFGVSVLVLFFVFLGFYVYFDLNQDVNILPLKDKSREPLYPNLDNKDNSLNSNNAVLDTPVSNNVLDNPPRTIINRKSNVNLDDIKNSTYYILNNKEVNFIDGSFKSGSILYNISKYAFGDINGDGNGDAVVVISTDGGNATKEELHVVINKNGVTKTFKVNPSQDDNAILGFNSVSIKKGEIILDMEIMDAINSQCCNRTKETVVYKFSNQNLVPINNAVSWKTYVDNKFGFEFMYPGDSKPIVKSVFIDGREVFDSINVVIPLRFDNEYNTWTKKFFEVSVLKQSCPFRNEAFIVNKNNINFYFFNPNYNDTSDNQEVLKKEEYMATKVGYCFFVTSNISGPGIDSSDYPKSSIVTSPPDVYEFFNQEFIILDRVLDTFKLL